LGITQFFGHEKFAHEKPGEKENHNQENVRIKKELQPSHDQKKNNNIGKIRMGS